MTVEGMELESILSENGGELTPELESRLDALLSQGKDKIEAAACVVREMDAHAEALRAEAKRLADRAVSFDNQAERLKQRMVYAVDAAFGGKLKTDRFTIWAQNSAGGVQFECADVSKLPDDLVKVTRSLNKDAAKELYKRGELPAEILAAEYEGKRYLRIK